MDNTEVISHWLTHTLLREIHHPRQALLHGYSLNPYSLA